MQFPIESSRLSISPFRSTDFDQFYQVVKNPQVMHFIVRNGMPLEMAKESFDLRLRLYQQFPEMGSWKVCLKESGEYIGHCNYNYIRKSNLPQLGYLLLPEFWGKGYATEIAQTLSDYHRTRFAHSRYENKLYALTDNENTASQNVLEKVGFQYVKRAFYYGTWCRFYVQENRKV